RQRWFMSVAAPEAEATQATDSLSRTMLILSIICLLIVAGLTIVIARQLVKPILIIRDECMLLADGDLRDRKANVTTEDEIGQLAKGFRDMRANLHSLVTTVHSQAEQLAASSQQL
ncbi:MAG TPA: methyl-accepting chemotaxis protein, partial [Sporomusaceae bacterium]|nr:methyl-accepting chemotaxis protein [Sporomusaceae bacterium]